MNEGSGKASPEAIGQTVAAEAFVLIARSGVRRSPVAHRVDLLSADQVAALVRRREAILADRISPRYAAEAATAEVARSEASVTVLADRGAH